MAELGDSIKDSLTGFTGIVTAKCEYLYGCLWTEVTPKGICKTTGLPIEPQWFDDPRLKKVGTRKKVTMPAPGNRTYGPPRQSPGKRIGPPKRHVKG